MHDPHSGRMSAGETRAAGGLALVFAFRMLGMFMVLPVLATYGMDLHGATPALIGLAIGAYGLTQAVLQIPFGMLSDRIGRLPVIYVGLLIFAAGAVLAASADSIWGVIAGRVLQGAGAISAAGLARLSDLARGQRPAGVGEGNPADVMFAEPEADTERGGYSCQYLARFGHDFRADPITGQYGDLVTSCHQIVSNLDFCEICSFFSATWQAR